jgi:hypothetical protein
LVGAEYDALKTGTNSKKRPKVYRPAVSFNCEYHEHAGQECLCQPATAYEATLLFAGIRGLFGGALGAEFGLVKLIKEGAFCQSQRATTSGENYHSRDAHSGAVMPASRRKQLASSCTDHGEKSDQISRPGIAVNPNGPKDPTVSCQSV